MTSKNLFLYSIILIFMAVIGVYYPVLLPLGAIFSPLGHEIVIKKGRKSEKNKSPLFTEPDSGILVLGVFSGYPAAKAGLEKGDIITEIDGIKMNSVSQFHTLIENKKIFQVKIANKDKKIIKNNKDNLGIYFLNNKNIIEKEKIMDNKSFLKKLFSKLKGESSN